METNLPGWVTARPWGQEGNDASRLVMQVRVCPAVPEALGGYKPGPEEINAGLSLVVAGSEPGLTACFPGELDAESSLIPAGSEPGLMAGSEHGCSGAEPVSLLRCVIAWANHLCPGGSGCER